ncbi:ribonuclease HIII [Streptococcus sp. CSL10205-OR2]|uniref:ribonuclease HIII n=1 Tax=Streptococcus sp. CSL10205-OR2 TaxID=2980558 RepID=UPI0021D9D268|nr:ribonuclease HIII [Streptococcus sp. CSL10205-OR2]MCU9533042.1 ribonuclease HIII [Streptococcus sp. CSL10205-OR2]
MDTIVIQVDKTEELTKLKKQLAPYQINSNNPYVLFAAKKEGVSVSVYSSGKVVFQGKNSQPLVQALGFPVAKEEKTSSSHQNLAIIGSDEVGNGSYFGGIAVVASFVEPKDHSFLKELGVDDSKTLTDGKIKEIAPLLQEKIPHKSLLLPPSKYNEVVGKGLKHNAVSVKVALHNQAIYLLLQQGVKPKKIVIDAFTSPKNYEAYLSKEQNRFSSPLTFEEKAEGKYLAVAVSSIIARYLFLKNLDELGQSVGVSLPSGAGHQSDQVASEIIKKFDLSTLSHLAKLHFKNTEKAKQLL